MVKVHVWERTWYVYTMYINVYIYICIYHGMVSKLDASSAPGLFREVKFWNQLFFLTAVIENKNRVMACVWQPVESNFASAMLVTERDLWSNFIKVIRNRTQTLLFNKGVYILEVQNVHLPGSSPQLGRTWLYAVNPLHFNVSNTNKSCWESASYTLNDYAFRLMWKYS